MSVSNLTPMSRDFCARPAQLVAPELLGKLLIRKLPHELLVGKIVETEAYLPFIDPAAHSYRGQTSRNAALFGPPGHAYVHRIHKYFCLDVVADIIKISGSVLIRALEPLAGLAEMCKNRGVSESLSLTSGPGKLCQAFNITLQEYGLDLCDNKSNLFIAHDQKHALSEIVATKRVGISKARDWPLRFYLKDSSFVSKR